MNCPRDNSLLDSVKKGELDVNVCNQCYGFSVSLGQDAATALAKQLRSRFASQQPQSEKDSLVSPFTGNRMSRFTYRGVELDYCAVTNSVWFDRGEYSRIFQSPEPVEKPASSGGGGFDGWDVIDQVGNTVCVLEIAGDLVVGAISGFDIL